MKTFMKLNKWEWLIIAYMPAIISLTYLLNRITIMVNLPPTVSSNLTLIGYFSFIVGLPILFLGLTGDLTTVFKAQTEGE